MQNQSTQSKASSGSQRRIRDEILAAAIGDARPCDDGFERSFKFDPAFSGFDGHFPNDPILPGVMQVLMVHASVADRTGLALRLVKAKAMKFREIIRPGDPIRVVWTETEKPDDEQIQCTATLTVGQATAASMKLTFALAPEADHAP